MVDRTGPSPIIPDYDSMEAIEFMIEDCRDSHYLACALSNRLHFLDWDVKKTQEKLNAMLEDLGRCKHWMYLQ